MNGSTVDQSKMNGSTMSEAQINMSTNNRSTKKHSTVINCTSNTNSNSTKSSTLNGESRDKDNRASDNRINSDNRPVSDNRLESDRRVDSDSRVESDSLVESDSRLESDSGPVSDYRPILDDEYVCSLDEASAERARAELHEDPDDRLNAVKALRDWTQQEKAWLCSPTDTKFLLSFLRICKFSQLGARERLVNFLASFNDSVSYLNGNDPGDPKFLNILRKSRVYTPMPKRDSENRTIILGNYEHFDPSGASYEYADFQRAILSICHSLVFCDEYFQVHGVNFLMDYGAITMKHITFGGSENMKKRSAHFQKALPVLMKQFHNYNNGPIFNVLVHILRPTLPEKMRVRVFTHGHSMVSVYKTIDRTLLPDEYLPDDHEGPSAGTLEDITERNIEALLLEPSRRAFIKDLWSGKYYADLTQRPKIEEGYGSFRKIHT